MPRCLRLLLDSDGDAGGNGNGGGAGESDSAGAGDGSGSDGSGESDSADSSRLKSTLDKVRAEKRDLEKQLQQAKRAAGESKSLEQRLQELESENKQMRLRGRVAELLETHQKAAGKDGFTVDAGDARELLDMVALTDDNVESAVEKVVAKVRRPNTAKGPENRQAGDGSGSVKFDVSKFNPASATLMDWYQLQKADPAEFDRQDATYRKSLEGLSIRKTQ